MVFFGACHADDPWLEILHAIKCLLSGLQYRITFQIPLNIEPHQALGIPILACSGVEEKAGSGAMGMDSRCGAMALRMMLRRMPAASS